MFELVIVWADGLTDVYEYETREQAETARRGMERALGYQIAWACTRPKQW